MRAPALARLARKHVNQSCGLFHSKPVIHPSRGQFSSSSRAAQTKVNTSSESASNPSLANIIENSIAATGPMPVARYMQLCLTHPTLGYYSQGDVFGQKGDFITSPEISQIFGELVAVWLLTRWMAAGSPARCRIIELGPGRGTLMDDILRTLQTLGKLSIESVHLVEASAKMREVQRDKLQHRSDALGASLHWHDHVDGVKPSEDVFTLAVAHEFFDALPIHILQRTQDGFREIRVDRNASFLPAAKNSQFTLAMDRESSLLSSILPAASSRYMDLPVGSRVEISPDSSHMVRSLAKLMQPGGAGLIMDYGGDRSFSSSFRAFRKHSIVDVFDTPGSADLTANVDFAYLKESMEATPFGPIPQSQFLLAMGLEPRLSKLMSSAHDAETKERIDKGAKRLIDSIGMGSQYQVMGFALGPTAEGEVYPFPTQRSDIS